MRLHITTSDQPVYSHSRRLYSEKLAIVRQGLEPTNLEMIHPSSSFWGSSLSIVSNSSVDCWSYEDYRAVNKRIASDWYLSHTSKTFQIKRFSQKRPRKAVPSSPHGWESNPQTDYHNIISPVRIHRDAIGIAQCVLDTLLHHQWSLRCSWFPFVYVYNI